MILRIRVGAVCEIVINTDSVRRPGSLLWPPEPVPRSPMVAAMTAAGARTAVPVGYRLLVPAAFEPSREILGQHYIQRPDSTKHGSDDGSPLTCFK
jgi:hypothetical protein